MTTSLHLDEVDPFDLPEWLGTEQVTWSAATGIRGGHEVTGELHAPAHSLACDLLGADQAYPRPVVEEEWRQRAHQAWTHGQVQLVERSGRLTLLVPGTGFTADGVLESLGRLAKAVGAPTASFVAALRL